MSGNVRIIANPFWDIGHVPFALGQLGITQVLTEPNGTFECTMTSDQVSQFQTRFPQHQLIQLQAVPADQPTADTYADQAPPAADPGIEGGETVSADPNPN